MTPDHCAELLRDADPDRFASVLAAEPRDRGRLATLYAANLEIAQAALASKEPLIAQMRLQWWADQIGAMSEGSAPLRHDVATPLFAAWGPEIAPLVKLIEARRHDAMREAFQSEVAVLDYIDGCTGTLMRLAAQACGLTGQEQVIANQARGAGLAAWLGAYPSLRALHLGLEDDSPARLADLAATGLAALDSARMARPRPPRRAAPALFAGAGARRKLRAIRDGNAAQISEFSVKYAYTALALWGRWQG